RFEEPPLLGNLLRGSLLPRQCRLALPAGWATHYLIGSPFALMYYGIYNNTRIAPTMRGHLSLGLLSGAMAISCWHFALRMHPKPPRISYQRFYLHLLLAHLVYGQVAGLWMKSLLSKHRSQPN